MGAPKSFARLRKRSAPLQPPWSPYWVCLSLAEPDCRAGCGKHPVRQATPARTRIPREVFCLAPDSRAAVPAVSGILRRLRSERPRFHESGDDLTAAFRLDDLTLAFLDGALQPGMRTVETGAGASTVVFAANSASHTCIAPDAALFRRIRHYCRSVGVDDRSVTFIVDRSEQALPRLHLGDVDVALIDGRHGFPAPFIDWYYLAESLKIGGLLVVDDVDIWTGETLADFLETETDWKLVTRLPRGTVFEKRGATAHNKEWTQQPFVYRRSKAACHHTPEPPTSSDR